MPSARRFPPPWSVDEQDACLIVRDATGQALGLLSRDEARWTGRSPAEVNFRKSPPLFTL